MRELLLELKRGDAVIVKEGPALSPEVIRKVGRVTELHIILSDGQRYSVVDGRRSSGGGYGHIDRIATQADLDRYAETNLTHENSKVIVRAHYDQRKELSALFAETLHAGVSCELGGDESLDLIFRNVTEEDIRSIAELLKEIKQSLDI